MSTESKEKSEGKNIGAEIGRVREFAEEHDIPEDRADKMVKAEITDLKEQASTEDRDLTAPNEQGHMNDPQAPSQVMSTPGSMLMQYLDESVSYNTDVPNDYREGEIRTLDDGTQVKVVGVTTTPVVEVVGQAPEATAPADPAVTEPVPGEADPLADPELDAEGNPIDPAAAPVADEPPAEEEPALNATGTEADVDAAVADVAAVPADGDTPPPDDEPPVEEESAIAKSKNPPGEEDEESEEEEEDDAPAALDISEDE